MRYFLISCILILLACTACQDHINIDQLSKDSQLVIYCFPSSQDTTEIFVSSSIPVKGKNMFLDTAQVSCTVNGVQREVKFLKKVDAYKTYQLVYYFTGQLQAKDRITVQASAKGMKAASSTTTIPAVPEITKTEMGSVFNDGVWYDQIRLSLKNSTSPAKYAVRVIGLAGDYDGDLDSIITHKEVEEVCTYDEPVLNKYSLGEKIFDESNDFYQNFYVFDNSSFLHDSTYTLHLDIRSEGDVRGYYVELYRLTPELYNFFKSVNDSKNNSTANYGISFVRPSYTNINNGIGVMGGYAMTKSNWIKEK